MLGEKFETWLIDPLSDATLITVDMHITNLGYLENKSLYLTKLPDCNIEESNRMLVGLDTVAIF